MIILIKHKQLENMAALYCRLSRDDGGEAESNSISTQRMMLEQYAKEHGLQVYSEYIDDWQPKRHKAYAFPLHL